MAETLSKWLRYIACDGQVRWPRIGYSPLPPNLSQEIVNSIGRMNGQPPDTLTASNCANPRFKGSLGAGAEKPPDPLASVADGALAAGGGGVVPSGGGTPTPGGSSSSGGGSGSSSGTGGGGSGGSTGTGTGSIQAAAGAAGTATAVGGGSSKTRLAAPVVYDRPVPGASGAIPVALLLLVIVAPLIFISGATTARRRPAAAPAARAASDSRTGPG